MKPRSSANFTSTNNFNLADFTSADFTSADFTSADFTSVPVAAAEFTSANASSVPFPATAFTVSTFTSVALAFAAVCLGLFLASASALAQPAQAVADRVSEPDQPAELADQAAADLADEPVERTEPRDEPEYDHTELAGEPEPRAGAAELAGEPADEPAGEKPKAWEGTWSLYGASLAAHQENGVSSYAVGIELSDVHIGSNQLWYGYFADLRYSDLARGVDLTLGVEAGASVVGVDAGLYVRLGRNPAVGMRARGCLSALVVISICAGGGYTNRGAFFEGSVLLKYGRRRSRPPRSDPNADAETREQDEATTVEIEGAVDDEGVFVDDAELEERVDPAESSGESESATEPNDRSAASDLGAVQVEAAADVLETDPRTDPELVEPAEVDAVDERHVDPKPASARALAPDGAGRQRGAE